MVDGEVEPFARVAPQAWQEAVCCRVIDLQATACAYIQLPVTILEKRFYEIVAQRCAVVGDVAVGGEFIAVVAVEAVFGGYPHDSVAVLVELVDKAAGEVVVGIEHANGLSGRGRGGAGANSQEQ